MCLGQVEQGAVRQAVPGRQPVFLTWNMAREFLGAALVLCQKELYALGKGGSLLDPWELAWESQRPYHAV